MKQFLIDLWKRIDGNKTGICWGIPAILQLMIKYNLVEKTDRIQFVIELFTLLGSGAFIHHVSKGSFRKDKN